MLQKKLIKKDNKGHFTILKGRIHQEYVNILNIYAPNIGVPKHIRNILEDFKKEIDSNTLIEKDLTPPCQKWIDLPDKILVRILQY